MSPSIPDTIRALVTREDKTVTVSSISFGSTEKVKNLAAHEVVVRVRAVGLNPTDWKHAFTRSGPGLVVGCDSAGDVVKVGSNVKNVQVGDRVAGFLYGTTDTDNGSFAEYVRYDSAVVFKLPEEMTYEEGASFPIPHYTAVQALYMRLSIPHPSTSSITGVPKHITILIWGGSTAVGHHALQLAHHSGLRVFVAASFSAHANLKQLGADECFDYKDPDVVKKIKQAAGEKGIGLALDCVAENGTTDLVVDSIGESGGRVITILPAPEETVNRRPDVQVNLTVVYTELGYEINMRGTKIPAMPQDRETIAAYLSNELPTLLQGWKAGSGSPKFQTQKLRSIEGGFEGIIEGMKILQKGEYAQEKLVVKLA